MRIAAFLFLSVMAACAQLTLRSAAYPPLFKSSANLLTITNDLVLWLKTDAITGVTDNEHMTGAKNWTDSSTNNKPAGTSSVGPVYKLNQLNGLPGVSFNGVDEELGGTTPTTSNTCSMFCVIKFNAATGTEYIMRFGETTGFAMEKSAGNRAVLHRAVAECVDGSASTSPEIWASVRTAAPLERFWVNGLEFILSNNGSACSGPDSGGYFIGRFGAVGFWMAGQIYEILLYSVPLSDSDRQKVQLYLSIKWGIAL